MGRGVLAVLAAIVAVTGAAVASTSHASAQNPQPSTAGQAYVPGEVIVRFKPQLGFKARQAILGAESAAVDEQLLLPGAALVKLQPGDSVSAAVSDLEQHANVLDAQPNYVYEAERTPSDPIFNLLWGLQNTAQLVQDVWGTDDADIDAPEAWELNTGSDSVKVAVVDTGVEYDHPDLAGNIAELGWDYYSNDPDPRDENGHGTHVAGTIGAQGENGVGVAGVSWNVGLMPIRVLGPTGSGTTAMITNGFIYAAQHGAKVVNASLGSSMYDPALASAISAAAGTLFVVPAGNGSGDNVGDDNDLFAQAVYPCNYGSPNLVCVAATDQNDSLAAFSNYGTTSVDLAAPGVRIGSTFVGGTYVYNQGTSMAAPHVAGAAALLLAQAPTAGVEQLRAALLGSADVVGSLAGKVASSGRLNAHRALLAVAPPALAAPKPLPSRKVVKKVKKVAVCYRKRTVKIAKSQLQKYRKRGAKVGACKKVKKIGRIRAIKHMALTPIASR